nr:RNA ligase family protein [Pectobacterium sp. PL152]
MYLHSIPLLKYPRTPHLEGSRLQSGDDASDQIALKALAGRYVVIEEKIDGANSGVSFNETAELLLQSRGHYLAGGSRERQFNQFKLWATAHEMRFLELLEDRFVMYGEWAYSKHSVFYDRLPHYFHEFDIYDRRDGIFYRRHADTRCWPVRPCCPFRYFTPEKCQQIRRCCGSWYSARWRKARAGRPRSNPPCSVKACRSRYAGSKPINLTVRKACI